MGYTKFDDEQAKTLINATQVYEALKAQRQQALRFEGSMHWKKIKEKEYLYRGFTGGKSRSLGPRNEQTEQIKQAFELGSAAHKTRLLDLNEQVRRHAGFIKAVRLNRFPTAGARVIRALQNLKVPHRIIGTNALFAYEVSAGVLFMPEHVATEDIDVIFDARQSLQIAAKLGSKQLMGLLQKSDKSFKKVSDDRFAFAAVNDKGYRVDFITQGTDDPLAPDAFERLLDEDDLHPVVIDSLKWHIASPKFQATAFDLQGYPVIINTVDPRAFILHKYYVSQRTDRSPLKRARDESQARVMATIVHRELTHLTHSRAIIKLFPNAVIASAQSAMDDLSF